MAGQEAARKQEARPEELEKVFSSDLVTVRLSLARDGLLLVKGVVVEELCVYACCYS